MELTHSKRLIIKIGSSLLVDEKQKQFNLPWLVSLVDDVAQLMREGVKVLLVTSGAVACGNLAVGLTRNKSTLGQKQAAAAVGQIQLMQTYYTLFNQQGFNTAQILLTMEDIEARHGYVNLSNTINNLLKMGIIPIINENDCVATEEIRYGDNDRLSARVAQMIEADTLVILSDVDGLYTENPTINPQAQFLTEVKKITPEILSMATDSITEYGTGGMLTKLQAAKIATQHGCHMLIISGQVRNPITHYLKTKRGTWFTAEISKFSAKKAWIKEHLKPAGQLVIDLGAEEALLQGKSLLPAGVISIAGNFKKGDVVCIINQAKKEIGRGLSNYTSHEIEKIKGRNSTQLEIILGYVGYNEVIHRNNLVLMGESHG